MADLTCAFLLLLMRGSGEKWVAGTFTLKRCFCRCVMGNELSLNSSFYFCVRLKFSIITLKTGENSSFTGFYENEVRSDTSEDLTQCHT